MRWLWVLGGFVCVLVAAAAAVLPLVAARSSASPPLPDLGAAPAFALTDQHNAPFTNEDLAGKVWVADFTFTHCPTICPIMFRHLAQLQQRFDEAGLKDATNLVGFSVDPERDTPERLKSHGDKFGADHDYWKLLTGPRRDIWELCRTGFKLHVQDNPGNVAEPITHDGRFVVVDQAGRIRAYHDGTDPASVDTVFADVRQLLREAKAAR